MLSGDLGHVYSCHNRVSWTDDILSGTGQFCLYQVLARLCPLTGRFARSPPDTVIQQEMEAVNQSE